MYAALEGDELRTPVASATSQHWFRELKIQFYIGLIKIINKNNETLSSSDKTQSLDNQQSWYWFHAIWIFLSSLVMICTSCFNFEELCEMHGQYIFMFPQGWRKMVLRSQANFKERFPSCSRVKGEQSMSVSTGNGRSSMMYGGTDTPLYCSPRVIDNSGGLYLGGTNIEDSLPNKIILAVHPEKWSTHTRIILISFFKVPQIAMFMGSTWGPPGSCRLQMGPMLAPWTLLSEAGFPI